MTFVLPKVLDHNFIFQKLLPHLDRGWTVALDASRTLPFLTRVNARVLSIPVLACVFTLELPGPFTSRWSAGECLLVSLPESDHVPSAMHFLFLEPLFPVARR